MQKGPGEDIVDLTTKLLTLLNVLTSGSFLRKVSMESDTLWLGPTKSSSNLVTIQFLMSQQF